MKRILKLIVIFVTMAAMVTLFSSCGQTEAKKESSSNSSAVKK